MKNARTNALRRTLEKVKIPALVGRVEKAARKNAATGAGARARSLARSHQRRTAHKWPRVIRGFTKAPSLEELFKPDPPKTLAPTPQKKPALAKDVVPGTWAQSIR